MRVLLTGAYGQLGRCLLDRFPADWILLACGSAELDITNRTAVERIVRRFRPQVIMNAAAYTAVDKAETDRIRAMKINAIGPENLARAARQVGAQLLHVSTDYVFDGSKPTPYVESDPPCPANFYGLSKWEGEKRIQAMLPRAIIIRTAWMFSEYGNNFVKTMLRLAQSHASINVVNDQCGCPTYAGDLAQAMIALALDVNAAGVYHFCGDKAVSWYEFAQTIFQRCGGTDPALRAVEVCPIASAQYKQQACRPMNSMMRSERMAHLTSGWEQALTTAMVPIGLPHYPLDVGLALE